MNIFDATPDSDFIPAPIIETLAMFSSSSEPSALRSLVKLDKIFETSSFCSSGAVKLISVLASFETFCTIISTLIPFSERWPKTVPAIPGWSGTPKRVNFISLSL